MFKFLRFQAVDNIRLAPVGVEHCGESGSVRDLQVMKASSAHHTLWILRCGILPILPELVRQGVYDLAVIVGVSDRRFQGPQPPVAPA